MTNRCRCLFSRRVPARKTFPIVISYLLPDLMSGNDRAQYLLMKHRAAFVRQFSINQQFIEPDERSLSIFEQNYAFFRFFTVNTSQQYCERE